jgi:hypothetical protein
MPDNDMEHMQYLESIAKEDVRFVEMRESTYRGSWKRRGGPGVFMNLARKWDRLEHYASRTGWDLWATLHGGLEGEDGTALAEIRDLRRYLLLVEAELMSRHTTAVAEMERENRDAMVSEAIEEWSRNGVPLEDSNRHADRLPAYELPAAQFEQLPESDKRLFDRWTPDLWRLRENIDVRLLDDCSPHYQALYLHGTFGMGGPRVSIYFLDRRWFKEEDWSKEPIELNDKEWSMLGTFWPALYQREGDKWMMKEEFRQMWGRT